MAFNLLRISKHVIVQTGNATEGAIAHIFLDDVCNIVRIFEMLQAVTTHFCNLQKKTHENTNFFVHFSSSTTYPTPNHFSS